MTNNNNNRKSENSEPNVREKTSETPLKNEDRITFGQSVKMPYTFLLKVNILGTLYSGESSQY